MDVYELITKMIDITFHFQILNFHLRFLQNFKRNKEFILSIHIPIHL